MLAMDYKRLRGALRDIRFERRMTVPELAEETGLAKSTIYRLEELEEEPDRELDLDTLEKVTAALGITLSHFFAAPNRSITLWAVELSGTASFRMTKP
jgi:transcriptional regulator with XRE-family HTH domain